MCFLGDIDGGEILDLRLGETVFLRRVLPASQRKLLGSWLLRVCYHAVI